MAFAAVLVLIVLITPTKTAQMCTRIDRLSEVEQGRMLPHCQIANLTVPGIMTCSRACLTRRRCKSFNFNMETGECQLNSKTNGFATPQFINHDDFVFSNISSWPQRLAGACANHTCPLNSYCDPVNETHNVCKATGCLGIPTVENGQIDESENAEESPFGTVQQYTCDRGFLPLDEAVCQDDGTWSYPACASVSSCSMVKQYQPDSEDGEYWLRLTNFDNYITQIFCYDMSTPSPREFLTLLNINYGIYPRVRDYDCDGRLGDLEANCAGDGGEVWFSKIRVNITTMTVFRAEKTFANISHKDKYLDYGMAFDCYSPKEICGARGNFTIDLLGTGWRVTEEQKWEPIGHNYKMNIDRQMDGTLIILKCGGYGGGCRPIGDLVLAPFFGNSTSN